MQKLGPALAQKGRTGLSTATACASKYIFISVQAGAHVRHRTIPHTSLLCDPSFPCLPRSSMAWRARLQRGQSDQIGIAQPSCFISSLCIQSHARCILCRESVCAATCLQCECMQHMFLCTQPRSTCFEAGSFIAGTIGSQGLWFRG